MQLFIILLILGYSSAGLVEKFFPPNTLWIDGYKRESLKEPTEILVELDKGALTLQRVAFHKGIDTLQKKEDTKYYELVQWKDPQSKYWPLDFVKMKWPEGSEFSIEEARNSIIGMGIDDNNQVEVKYHRSNNECHIKKYYLKSDVYKTAAFTAC